MLQAHVKLQEAKKAAAKGKSLSNVAPGFGKNLARPSTKGLSLQLNKEEPKVPEQVS